MRIGKSLWPVLLPGLLLLGIAALISMRAGAQPAWDFERRSLVDASRAEIEQVALQYTQARFQILSGAPVVLVSGYVTKQDLPSLGLSQIDFGGQDPPLFLVLLKGDFDVRGMRAIPSGDAPARVSYIAYVFDLIAGAPTLISVDPEGARFGKLISNPTLLSDRPLPTATYDPAKPPYGATAVPVVPPSGVSSGDE